MLAGNLIFPFTMNGLWYAIPLSPVTNISAGSAGGHRVSAPPTGYPRTSTPTALTSANAVCSQL
ncbi:Uncharacterised protein [Mycobacterium tuberculosis]|uniref:Uncharacterized protein n=1 Tax=Mycobacterium tuberculosis TaxID=1773 RepID=A0A916LCB9_MYCTX|nr:Uncharacterised protein [Mycobacterium tuberculosis]COX96912.1 Uncharacterised protein [Mycobacterium tuberculosis]